jgi:hypothetical protein
MANYKSIYDLNDCVLISSYSENSFTGIIDQVSIVFDEETGRVRVKYVISFGKKDDLLYIYEDAGDDYEYHIVRKIGSVNENGDNEEYKYDLFIANEGNKIDCTQTDDADEVLGYIIESLVSGRTKLIRLNSTEIAF